VNDEAFAVMLDPCQSAETSECDHDEPCCQCAQ